MHYSLSVITDYSLDKENAYDAIYEKMERYDYDLEVEEDEEEGYFFNPEARYDAYVIGGRWENFLSLKNNQRATTGKIKDILIFGQNHHISNLNRRWEVVVEGVEKEKNEYYFDNKNRMLSKYKTKENYMRIESSFKTHALITETGEFYDEESFPFESNFTNIENNRDCYYLFFEKYLSEHPNYYLTVVDCHY